MIPYEIERKYLIRYPDLNWLSAAASASRITQTYLLNDFSSERVRKRETSGRIVYTHTRKQRISDLRRIEEEEEISEEEYLRLLERKDPSRKVIEKTRYCLRQNGFLYEIDIFPFWTDRAFLEVELTDESQNVPWPEQIICIREVTEDKRYTNSALARSVPQDEI